MSFILIKYYEHPQLSPQLLSFLDLLKVFLSFLNAVNKTKATTSPINTYCITTLSITFLFNLTQNLIGN